MRIKTRLALIKRNIYWWLGFSDHDCCEICLCMFDTRKGYGGWEDITSCRACGPTEADKRESDAAITNIEASV